MCVCVCVWSHVAAVGEGKCGRLAASATYDIRHPVTYSVLRATAADVAVSNLLYTQTAYIT